MSLIINNILDPNDVGTVSSGSLGLFAGPGESAVNDSIRGQIWIKLLKADHLQGGAS